MGLLNKAGKEPDNIKPHFNTESGEAMMEENKKKTPPSLMRRILKTYGKK